MRIILLVLLTGILIASMNSVDRPKNYDYQLSPDAGFENRSGWVTNGTTSWLTSGATVGFGVNSLAFDFSAGSQTSESALVSIPSGLRGQPCEASFYMKGWTSGGTLDVYDGTNAAVTGSHRTQLASDTNWTEHIINFPCTNQGQMKLRLTSLGNDAIGYVDQVYLGRKIKDETIVVRAWSSSGQTAAPVNTQNLVTYDQKDIDTAAAYNTATGTFTAPTPGKYRITASIESSATTASGAGFGVYIRKNSTVMAGNRTFKPSSDTDSFSLMAAVSDVEDLVTGDTIKIELNQGLTSGLTLSTDKAVNYLTIQRVGN